MAQEIVKLDREDVVIAEEIGRVGVITINRPKQLNVISDKVILLLGEKLEKLEKDDSTKLVIIKGAGKAFSAGGDLKMFYDGRKTRDSCLEATYRMYWLCYHIHTYKKPLVALVHGMSMGGGASLMTPMKFSVVTEKTVFSTPETLIGFHPDCGFSYMLSRLSGRLGEYLGLTGARLKGKEVVAAGLATHIVPSQKLVELEKCLLSLNSGDENAIESVIKEFSTDFEIHENSILQLNRMSIINECFSKDTVEEILMSFIREGRKQTLSECLKKEFRISNNILRRTISNDFYEGISAIVINKNNSPKWCPTTLEEVKDEQVNLIFKNFEQHLELQISEKNEHRWKGKYDNSPYYYHINQAMKIQKVLPSTTPGIGLIQSAL
ncbi:3-hydroxyisobutyryl-CoA hydrolase-like protein 5 isoform X2 [Solanum pennellii]|uniref:3-hydroxyisobutyryl-CoA hydrolase n=1 Tax=Solanum pennellii TaxID=28526 RepID=A0ABM1VCI8_SOLPN|nr:3-hydroxyisobutyryl-CoA hydrolase-like protein 5 isoform X2 [Solanum pennellii]